MPHIVKQYKPPILFRNGHIHTIYPALFRKAPDIPWERQRIRLPDTDFIDLDWYRKGNSRLVVLGHGLEGSTDSTYIHAGAKLFSGAGFDVLSWNQRSCSGEMNDLPRFYHHGATEDVHAVLQQTLDYNEVHYVGYSLGGNILLMYLGEGKYAVPQNFRSAVAISAPIDLPSCVVELLRLRNRIYHDRFLKSLKEKVRVKAEKMPDRFSAKYLPWIRTLVDFDNYYTAPLHGYASAEDYYRRASSRQYLPEIGQPALLLQARDDPMMGEGCYPVSEAKESMTFTFIDTRYGGHIAFTQPGSDWHWMEEVALDFICEHASGGLNDGLSV